MILKNETHKIFESKMRPKNESQKFLTQMIHINDSHK